VLTGSPTTSVAALRAASWVLPRSLVTANHPAAPAWTLIGTVGSSTATPVDPAGLVSGAGWSLDWWIGADDRWHLPSQESAVRQALIGDVPIVETRVRIPGGDAVHRAYGIRSPRTVGDEWVVVDIENATPVPFAAVVVVRPFVADGLGSVREITIEPTGGGRGRDEPHLVRVDGNPAVLLPRRPARIAGGNLDQGDVAQIVTSGDAGEELIRVTCDAGVASLACVFPVPHTAVLRVVLPVGEVDSSGPMAFPSVVPDAGTVASGWEVHQRGPRIELPEQRLQVAFGRARAAVQLAHDGASVRRDGARSNDLDPGATEVILGALDVLDRPADVGSVVARWVDRLDDANPEVDALVLASVARHWRLHRIDALLDWILPEVAAAVERIDRSRRRGSAVAPLVAARTARALVDASDLLAASGQAEAAIAVAKLATKLHAPDPDLAEMALAADRLVVIGHRLASGDGSALDALDREVADASITSAWSGPGRGGRTIGQDLAASAALVLAVRSALVAERPDGLELLPVFPPSWYGGGVELHDAPTAFGRLSFAVRWHGARPALLWDLEAHEGIGPVRLTVGGLDRAWSTTALRGDALLAEVTPPEGLELYREIAEHPDIDPVMRKPGATPQPPPPMLPDGGSFS